MLGVHFVELGVAVPVDEYRLQISWIDPAGPAARSGLAVGDVITTIDGVDVTGEGGAAAWTLMQAAPGTKLELGLARGATVTVTLAAPS